MKCIAKLTGFLLLVAAAIAHAGGIGIRVSASKKAGQEMSAAVDSAVFASARLGETVVIELPAGRKIEVVHDRRETMPSGNLYWGGYVLGTPGNYRVALAIGDSVAKGAINTPYGAYHVQPGADGPILRAAQQISSSDEDDVKIAPAVMPKSGTAKDLGDIDQLLALGDSSTETVTIDVLMLYTPGVAKRHGKNLQLHFDQLWGDVRSHYTKSDTRINMRLVASQQVGYTGANNIMDARNAIANADVWGQNPTVGTASPGLEGVYQARTALGADLVFLLADPADMVNSCGLSQTAVCTVGAAAIPAMSTWKFTPNFGGLFYAASEDWDYAGITIAHELGHLMGADHDRAAGCNGLFSYSCGLRSADRFGGGTVMAQGVHEQNWGVFSNPSLTSCGGPCGIAEGATNAADNARTLRRTRYIVSKYQSTKVPESLGDLSGMWWNSNESGWGVTMYHRRDIGFVAWYTYDRNGVPKWFVASDCRFSGPTCTGKLYETTYNGAVDLAAGFDPTKVKVIEVGTLSMDFSSSSRALMQYTINGFGTSKSLDKMVFSGSGQTGQHDWNALWWNPSESGWGVSITQQYDVMFVAWYSYSPDGRPTWYFASNCALTASRDGCTGDLYATSGPVGPEVSQVFNPAQVQIRAVGNISLTFTGADDGQMQYTVNGKSSTRRISRQMF